MEIRQYIDEDLEGVISVWDGASKVGHPFLDAEFINSERKLIPTKYLVTGDIWVAQIDGQIVGFTIFNGFEMGALFVDPEFHGVGVGYGLMEMAKNLHAEIKLEVFKKNIVGQKFYVRQGFTYVKEYFHEESGEAMLCFNYSKN